jgi:hypothetical protein
MMEGKAGRRYEQKRVKTDVFLSPQKNEHKEWAGVVEIFLSPQKYR